MAVPASNLLLEPALLERIKGLTLVARRVVEGALHGLHHSPLHGLSIEFTQHRAYTPGDELKRLDWRVLGRSDRYVIKQYHQETNLRAVIFLDCSRSMAFAGAKLSAFSRQPSAGAGAELSPKEPSPKRKRGFLTFRRDLRQSLAGASGSDTGPLAGANVDSGVDSIPDGQSKFHYARRMAAALAYLMLHQGDSVGLVLSNYRIVEQVPPRASPGHVMSICHALERTRPEGITDMSGVLGQLAGRLKRRSLLILISDLLDDPASVLSALGQLYHRGHEVIVFQVLDPREIDFDLGLAGYGRTVIRDMETGEEFDAEPALIRELVRGELGRFFAELDAGAQRHNIPLLRCATSDPVERVLTGYLYTRLKRERSLSFRGAKATRNPASSARVPDSLRRSE
ncbi:MAG: DUF58 domain-containing protein [Phycisphaerae bacterium]